jgi:heme/copper-type cytochrome/quinol oxidase subunit 2
MMVEGYLMIKIAAVLIVIVIVLSLIFTIQIGRNQQDEKYATTEKKRIIMLSAIYGVTFVLGITAFIIYLNI